MHGSDRDGQLCMRMDLAIAVIPATTTATGAPSLPFGQIIMLCYVMREECTTSGLRELTERGTERRRAAERNASGDEHFVRANSGIDCLLRQWLLSNVSSGKYL